MVATHDFHGKGRERLVPTGARGEGLVDVGVVNDQAGLGGEIGNEGVGHPRLPERVPRDSMRSVPTAAIDSVLASAHCAHRSDSGSGRGR